mmetsp:Transcript_77882/g.225236  ORF Transcript_77882/g.225236 Transcript_77882/m.225236 type:complete len:227 (+) Transcript_77882:479-1159(+)
MVVQDVSPIVQQLPQHDGRLLDFEQAPVQLRAHLAQHPAHSPRPLELVLLELPPDVQDVWAKQAVADVRSGADRQLFQFDPFLLDGGHHLPLVLATRKLVELVCKALKATAPVADLAVVRRIKAVEGEDLLQWRRPDRRSYAVNGDARKLPDPLELFIVIRSDGLQNRWVGTPGARMQPQGRDDGGEEVRKQHEEARRRQRRDPRHWPTYTLRRRVRAQERNAGGA